MNGSRLKRLLILGGVVTTAFGSLGNNCNGANVAPIPQDLSVPKTNPDASAGDASVQDAGPPTDASADGRG